MATRRDGRSGSPIVPEGTLEALACDLAARPGDAPHFGSVEHAVVGVRREADVLVVEYAASPGVAEALERIVEAERSCCASMGWRLERDERAGARGGALRLCIEGTPEQVEAARLLFPFGG
jgi:hypothetical protein